MAPLSPPKNTPMDSYLPRSGRPGRRRRRWQGGGTQTRHTIQRCQSREGGRRPVRGEDDLKRAGHRAGWVSGRAGLTRHPPATTGPDGAAWMRRTADTASVRAVWHIIRLRLQGNPEGNTANGVQSTVPSWKKELHEPLLTAWLKKQTIDIHMQETFYLA